MTWFRSRPNRRDRGNHRTCAAAARACWDQGGRFRTSSQSFRIGRPCRSAGISLPSPLFGTGNYDIRYRNRIRELRGKPGRSRRPRRAMARARRRRLGRLAASPLAGWRGIDDRSVASGPALFAILAFDQLVGRAGGVDAERPKRLHSSNRPTVACASGQQIPNDQIVGMTLPPLTERYWPVMNEAKSEARKATALAMSWS
jgi:hypothetical protein